jgi:Xaa-Pro aminopeptidase
MTFEKSTATRARDTLNPPKLLTFMMQGWRAPVTRKRPRVKHAAVYAARRQTLARALPGQFLVIPTGHQQVRSNDTFFRFRPGSDFVYLTGNHEPDCVLVIDTYQTPAVCHLFVEANPGRSDATFYTDRNKGELWVGPRLGVHESQHHFGVDAAHPIDTLAAFLKGKRSVAMVRGLSATVDGLAQDPNLDTTLAATIAELRLTKDKLELLELKKAIASTYRGFEDVLRQLGSARSEREVEAHFGLRARVEGNDVGYGTIAASGAHACILHWTKNDGKLKPNELLLLDAGVEAQSLYTADITRTFPLSGRFSKAQRQVYDLVFEAQQAAFAAVRPGADFMEPNRRAMKVLAQGLIDLGILTMSLSEALDDQHQYFKRYTLHNISHMLGLDVHDCAKARQEVYRYGPLKPGMVLTIEPGLYFQQDDLTVPKRFRGIGVRLEDDVLVTNSGMRNLSAQFPRESQEVETWMRRVRSKKPVK